MNVNGTFSVDTEELITDGGDTAAWTPVIVQGTWNPTSTCLLYTSPSPRDRTRSRMPSSA